MVENSKDNYDGNSSAIICNICGGTMTDVCFENYNDTLASFVQKWNRRYA